MVEITDAQWRVLMWLGAGVLVSLVSMFAYVVKTAREAYLGHRWVQAAGSYERAARELRRFDCETDALLIQHAGKLRPGQALTLDRVHIEKALGLETPERVGTLVLDDGRRFPWHDGMRVTMAGDVGAGGGVGTKGAGAEHCVACGHAWALHVTADSEDEDPDASSCNARGCSCPVYRGFSS